MLTALIIVAVFGGAVVIEKRRAAKAGQLVPGTLTEASAAAPEAGIAAAIAPAPVPAVQIGIGAILSGAVIGTVAKIVEARKASRAAFSQLWPLLTGAEQQEWVGRKSLSLHTSLFNALSRHRRVRQYEDGMVAKYIVMSAQAMHETVTENLDDVSWLQAKPDNVNVDLLVTGQRGVGAEHDVTWTLKSAWDRIGGARAVKVVDTSMDAVVARRAGFLT